MYDKIHSNMEEKHLSLDEALKKVQDGYGLRTIMEDFDYKKYPEIVEMYKKDPEKAYRMAAEKQSEHIVEMLKDVLTRQINSGDFEIMTLSNYKGQDGIPYLSDKQVKELMEYANQRGVKLDVKTDDNGFAENVKDSDVKVVSGDIPNANTKFLKFKYPGCFDLSFTVSGTGNNPTYIVSCSPVFPSPVFPESSRAKRSVFTSWRRTARSSA